jgi:ribosome recycling factor
MDQNQVIDNFQDKMGKAVDHFSNEIKKIRTGRAHASMLDGIIVEVYGSTMPLVSVATITVPEPQLIQISPFDPTTMQSIISAIRDNQTLGLNPTDDGRIIRVPIPALSSERRQQIVKQLKEKLEDSLVNLRNLRHEALKSADKLKADKAISEDDYKRIEKKIDEIMNIKKIDIDKMSKIKEQDIMTL